MERQSRLWYNRNMKVWIKYLIGIVIGIAASFILPMSNTSCSEVFAFLSDLFIRFGRYIVIPLVFCTAVISINKLRTSKLFGKTLAWTAAIIVISSLLLTFIGLISILIVKLPRIPITIDIPLGIDIPKPVDKIKEGLLKLFPSSGFDALREGSFILASLVLGFLFGWASAADEVTFKPVITFFDSLSKLVYHIAVFFTEITSVLMVAIMCYWISNFKVILSPGIYTPMIIMFLVDFIIVAGIIYPVIIRFLCHDTKPYRVLYAALAPMMLSFICADSNMVLPLTIRNGKESLGIRRRCGGFTYPMFSIFARGGSALVSVISFVLIFRSYSSLGITISDLFWLFGFALGWSFLLGGTPAGGAFFLLQVICSTYGKGYDTSYLLLQPAKMIICSFACLFDSVTAMFGSYIVAVKTKMIEHHPVARFI